MCKKSWRSEQLEIYDSWPTTSRWHLMMMMMIYSGMEKIKWNEIWVAASKPLDCRQSQYELNTFECLPLKVFTVSNFVWFLGWWSDMWAAVYNEGRPCCSSGNGNESCIRWFMVSISKNSDGYVYACLLLNLCLLLF